MKPTWMNLLRLAYTNSKDVSLGARVETLTNLIGKNTTISKIKADTVLQIINNLKAKGLKGPTINRHLSILSKVATVYRRQFNPQYALFIPWQKEGSGRFEWLREDDEYRIVNYLQSINSNDIALCISVLTTTGMRIGELCSLEPDQIDGDWIRLWETKTNRPRSVPLTAGSGEQLRALVARDIPKAHQIRRGLSDALKAVGVSSNITPHSLRHTTATRLVKAGVNLHVAGKYLGHNSLRTTQRYVHIEDADIRTAMNKMVPS